ncbi:MAG: acyltransferase [Sphingorhabdus sp.]
MMEKIILGAYHLVMTIRVVLTARVKIGHGVRFKGLSMVDIRAGASLRIGDGTLINSRNFGYHLNMFRPCKFLADRPGAEIIIGKNCRIHGTCIHAYERITIGDNCLIAANSQIFDGNGHSTSLDDVDNRINTTGGSKPVTIGDSVWIGTGVNILPGVTIGRGAIIAAGSVVKDDVPPLSVVAGNPAAPIARR